MEKRRLRKQSQRCSLQFETIVVCRMSSFGSNQLLTLNSLKKLLKDSQRNFLLRTCMLLMRPIRYSSAEEILKEFCVKRLEYYTRRKRYLLKSYRKDLKIASNRYLFVKSVVDGNLEMNQKDEALEQDMEDLGLVRMFEGEKEGYEYLLSMQMKSMTLKKLNELEKYIDSLNVKISELRAKTEGDIWKEDLDVFEAEYDRFLENRKDD